MKRGKKPQKPLIIYARKSTVMGWGSADSFQKAPRKPGRRWKLGFLSTYYVCTVTAMLSPLNSPSYGTEEQLSLGTLPDLCSTIWVTLT
jgi:hypothetical protein